MSTKSMPWFRMYVDFLNDPKIIALAFEDQRHFIGVLALKRAGVLDQQCDPDLRDRIVAQRLWIDHSIIRDVKKRLVASGLIDATWQPIAWDKNQKPSDGDPTGAERQRRYRERQAADEGASQTDAADHRLDDRTPRQTDQRDGDDSNADSNALRDGGITPLDKKREDKSREEPEDKKRAPRKRGAAASAELALLVADGVSLQHADDWLKVRKAKNQPLTQTAWDNVKRHAETAGVSFDDAVRISVENGWAGFNASWLAKAQPGAAGRPGAQTMNKQEALEARNREVAARLSAKFQAAQGGQQL
jgi:hypothetical protein